LRPNDLSEEQLWKLYKNTDDKSIEKRLIERYLPIVKSVVNQVYPLLYGNVDKEDLESYGIFGLIDAVRKFDLKKNVRFENYARIRIRGAIFDNIRTLSWFPRSFMDKVKRIEGLYQKKEQELGRIPTDEEMAEELGVSVDKFRKMLAEVRGIGLVSLEEREWEAKDLKYDPLTISLDESLRDVLKETIDNLPERERYIISLYYYEGLSFKEIAKVLGLSESRISQIHTKTLLLLRSRLNEALGG